MKGPAAQLTAASAGGPWQQLGTPLLAASIVVMGCRIAGMRTVLSLPIDLRANWIFRVAPVRGGPQCLAARRRALFALSVIPVCAASAVLFISIAPLWMAVEHVVVLGLLSMLMAELCLAGAQKIPFTCSYLPGKSKVYVTFWLSIGFIIAVIRKAAAFERHALEEPRQYALLICGLAVLVILARLRNRAVANRDGGAVQFEDEESDAMVVLGLEDARKAGSQSA